MMSRGPVSCPVKGGSSIEVESWDVPWIVNSNDLPNYKDTSGEVVRRIAVINFSHIITDDEKDTALEDALKKTEFATFLHRCRTTYLDYCDRYAGREFYTFCPPHFLETRDMLQSASNNSYQFGKTHLAYAEGSRIMKPALTKMFREYVKEKYSISRTNEVMDIHSIANVDSRWKSVSENICKSCRAKHIKGCCSEYSRTNRSKAEYILNARYSCDEIDEPETPESTPVAKPAAKLCIKCKKTSVPATGFKKVCDACIDEME
jgi:hypothetical protein